MFSIAECFENSIIYNFVCPSSLGLRIFIRFFFHCEAKGVSYWNRLKIVSEFEVLSLKIHPLKKKTHTNIPKLCLHCLCAKSNFICLIVSFEMYQLSNWNKLHVASCKHVSRHDHIHMC